jgi:hypothetical protein
MTPLDWDIQVNQAAQGLREVPELLVAFAALSEEEERSVLRRVNVLALQAGARDSDAAAAIVRSGVRPTRTSAVLMAKGPINIQLAKAATLPQAELSDGVRVAIALLAIADERRRRTKCASGCSHWWHKDLRDDVVLGRIRRGDIQ